MPPRRRSFTGTRGSAGPRDVQRFVPSYDVPDPGVFQRRFRQPYSEGIAGLENRDQLDRPFNRGLRRGTRRERHMAACALVETVTIFGQTAGTIHFQAKVYASSGFTTVPATSVSRNARP